MGTFKKQFFLQRVYEKDKTIHVVVHYWSDAYLPMALATARKNNMQRNATNTGGPFKVVFYLESKHSLRKPRLDCEHFDFHYSISVVFDDLKLLDDSLALYLSDCNCNYV